MKNVARVLLLTALLVCQARAADDDTARSTPSDSNPNAAAINSLTQVAGTLIEGVTKVQKDAKKKGSDLMKRTEALLDEQEAQQKRFAKILDTWERQQAQYQKYLDSLDKK